MSKDRIEVGEYIRTRNGLIFKVDKQFKNIQINDFQNLAGERDIVKHSKNIIDLIEVGDYVNGCKVLKIEKEKGHITVGQEVKRVVDYNYIFDNEIETIVTKEQFKEMEYRV